MLLVAILLYAKKKLTPSGEVTIDINEGEKELKVNPGSSLLSTLGDLLGGPTQIKRDNKDPPELVTPCNNPVTKIIIFLRFSEKFLSLLRYERIKTNHMTKQINKLKFI